MKTMLRHFTILLVILLLLPLAGCGHTCDFTEPVPDSRHSQVIDQRVKDPSDESQYLYFYYVADHRNLYSCKCGKIASVIETIDAHPGYPHRFTADSPVTGEYECEYGHELFYADFTGWAEYEFEVYEEYANEFGIKEEDRYFIQGMTPFNYENPEAAEIYKGRDEEFLYNLYEDLQSAPFTKKKIDPAE